MSTTTEDFWKNFLESIALESNSNIDLPPILPTSFLDTISPNASSICLDNLAGEIFQITQFADQSKTIPFLVEHSNITMITIATGFNREVSQIHHFFESGTSDNDQALFALSGLKSAANILSLIPSRLFNKTSAMAPSFETLCDPEKISQMPNAQFEDSDLQPIEVSNSIILPPRFAYELAQQDCTSTSETLQFALDFVIEEDARLKLDWQLSTPLDEDGSRDLANQPQWKHAGIKQYALLLQTLYYWNTLQSHRSPSFRLSHDDTATKYLNALTEGFHRWTRNPPEGRDPFADLPPPPTPAIVSPPDLSIQRNPLPTLTDEQSSACNALGLDPNTFAFLSAMQSNSVLPNQDQQSNQGQAMALNRLAGALDKFSDATSANISEKQKLPKVLTQAIKNAMTSDGESPAPELTQTMKDAMQGTEENLTTLIEIILKRSNAAATPTPRFVRGFKKGLWTYTSGSPDNCTVVNLPHSLTGTPFENLDYAALKEEESRGRNLTQAERDALYKNSITVSKTMNYLLMKAKAWHAIISEAYGEDTALVQEAENWVTFLQENLQQLMARQANFDRDLPARIESSMAEEFNEFFLKAKHGVPPISLLDGDAHRQALLRGYIKPDLSKTIEEALRPTPKDDRKRKAAEELQPPPAKRSDHVHTNQPNELKMAHEKFHLLVQKQISNKRVKVPMCYPTNSNECCKYVFTGKCNQLCPRAAAHIPPAGNRTRMDNLRKFVADCHVAYKANKSPTDPDFD